MSSDPHQSRTAPQHQPSPVAAMANRLELLRLRILRAERLSPFERDLLLDTLTAARRDLDDIARRWEGQSQDLPPSQDESRSGWPRA